MRIMWVCPLLLALAACSAPTPPSATNDSSADSSSITSTQAPPAAAPSVDDAWQLSQQTSPMDGEIVRAARIYKFPDMDTTVQAEFVCTVEKKQLQITLTSIVGNADNPSDASLFQSAGRLRFSDLPPQLLYYYFKPSGNFGNVIVDTFTANKSSGFIYLNGSLTFISLGWVDDMLQSYLKLKDVDFGWIKEADGLPDSREYTDFKFNPTATLGNLFPIAIEAINGRGTLDLVIAKSKSISAVLNLCGGNGPVMDPVLSQLLKSGSGTAGGADATVPQSAAVAAGNSGAPTSDATAVDTASASQASANSSSSSKSAVAPASAQIPNSAVESSMSGAADRSVTGAGNPQSLLRASFDCTKASSPTERAICSDVSLSDLDGRMAVAYKQLLSRDPLALPEQRDWMKQRNQCGGDIGCLTSSYQGRLQKIQEIMATINK